MKQGQEFTFYMGGMYQGDALLGIDKSYDRSDSVPKCTFTLWSYEGQFEIGENVIVHLSKESIGPASEDDSNYILVIVKFSKYKVIEDKAYNENHPTCKSLDLVLDEAK